MNTTSVKIESRANGIPSVSVHVYDPNDNIALSRAIDLYYQARRILREQALDGHD